MPIILYRLVDSEHDTIKVGDLLNRCSDYSNQKLGDGIYFADSEDSALKFAKKGNHKYTHLLKCEITNTSENDFFDLINTPNAYANWKKLIKDKKVNTSLTAFCAANGKKGLKWISRKGWVEYVLHKQHVNNNIEIIESKEL